MASIGDGVEVYTSEGPCSAASTQYRGLVMVSKVKSRNAFSDIRCVVHIYLCRQRSEAKGVFFHSNFIV